MNRRYNAIKNIIYNIGNQILTLILAFVSRTIFIWGLGMEYLGLNGLFSDVLGLLSMADLGFGVAMAYSFYQPLANNDEKKLSGLVNFYKKAYRIIAVLVLIIGVILIPFLPYLINLDGTIDSIRLYYLLSLANVAASYLMVFRTAILSADQKNYEVVKIQLIVSIVRTVIQILAIIIFKNYTIYLLIAIISTLVGNIIASKKSSKIYYFLDSQEQLKLSERKEILKNISSVFIYKIANISLNATDNIIISALFGTIFVGIYSNYLLIQSRLVIFYSLIFSSITAGIGNVFVTEKPEKRLEIFLCEQSISSIVSMVIVPCYVSLVNSFIGVWIGKEYTFDLFVLLAIGLNLFFSCVLQPLWTFREASGLYDRIKWNMIACAVLNIILSILLGKLLGVSGVIFATSLSRILTYLWYEPYLLFSFFFNSNPQKFYYTITKDFTAVSLLTVLCIFFTSRFDVRSFIWWGFQAFFVFSFCIAITVFLKRKDKGFVLILSYIQKLLKRGKL